MKRPKPAPRVLLVEGKDEQYVLPELLELAGIPWPRGHEPVFIEESDGVENLLVREIITTELKIAGLEALGLVLDANGDVAGRWHRVRTVLGSIRADFPSTLDPAGIVLEEPGQPRLGVWLMPDNIRAGMLETLLLAASDEALRDHARLATATAKDLGAPFKDSHRDKALLHAWLAWQDPPGQQLPLAVKARSLNAAAPALAPFVAWFRRLYQI